MSEVNITKTALANALKELLLQVPFSKVSVRSICRICGLNRKSFYYHFKDKYDLLNWVFCSEFSALIQKSGIKDCGDLIRQLSVYFYANRAFYSRAFEVHGQNSFYDYFREFIQTILSELLRSYWPSEEYFYDFIAFFADVITCAIRNWLQIAVPPPPGEFCQLLRTSILSMARSIEESEPLPE